jgi:hypothetical protein
MARLFRLKLQETSHIAAGAGQPRKSREATSRSLFEATSAGLTTIGPEAKKFPGPDLES